MGLAIAFLLEGLQMAAQISGLQAGYSFASTVDPSTQADTTTLQLMAQLLAGSLFFAFGFDRLVLKCWPGVWHHPGRALLNEDMPLRRLFGWEEPNLCHRLTTGAASIGLLVLLDIAFAVLGSLHAQLQILSLAFAVKMLAALCLSCLRTRQYIRQSSNAPAPRHFRY